MNPDCLFDLATAIPTAKGETLAAFANSPIEPLRPLATHAAVKLVDESVSIGTPAPGFLALTAVAFDGARRDAVVKVVHVQGSKSMLGVVYHLVRDGGAWRKMELARCF